MVEQELLRTAHLDKAHIGDIHGAWGTITRESSLEHRSWARRLLTLLIIMGPGLVTMVGDNDVGGITTYTQAGQNYGTSLLWVLLLLIPILIVNQEMVVRLGAVTGVGHARLIFARFGKFWGAFSVIDLFILNFLTIVTEFIGFAMALNSFGVSPFISVPIGVGGLIAITVTGSFRRWESAMWVCVLVSGLMLPLAFLPHPAFGPILRDTFLPTIRGGITSTALLVIIAIVGTTVAPWQLFFQQSNVIDKRITPRWIKQERIDTIIGAFLVTIEAAGLIVAAAFVFAGTALNGAFVNVASTARAYTQFGHPVMGVFLMLILLNASIIGANAVTLSTSYAFGDVFGLHHSLHRKVGDAKLFYGTFIGMVVLAGAIVLIPNAPFGLLILAVQALAGILLPSATVFLVLLCNDREVLGPWVNKAWQNILAAVIVGLLVMLSLILAAVTLFPEIDANALTLVLGLILVGSLVGMGLVALFQRHCQPAGKYSSRFTSVGRENWQMPPLAALSRPVWSATRTVGMLTLRLYLVIAVTLLVVKIMQLALR